MAEVGPSSTISPRRMMATRVADLRGDPEIVGDEQHGRPQPHADLLEKLEHLRLDRDVEGGDRLVGNQYIGLERERPRNADALALTAGELVGIALGRLLTQLDNAQEFPRAGMRLWCRHAVREEALGDDLPDRAPRIERGERVLEDHLHPLAVWAVLPARQLADLRAVDGDRTAIRLEQPDDDAAKRGLARAGLADEAQHFAAPYREVDIAQGDHLATAAEHPVAAAIGLGQRLRLEDDRGHHRRATRRVEARDGGEEVLGRGGGGVAAAGAW